MGAAVAVHERSDRPNLFEVAAVLVVCAGLLVALATIDDRAARREAAKATAVLAQRAERAGERAERESMTAPAAPPHARTDRLGRESSPIVIPAGPAWSAGTSVVSHTQKSDPDPISTPMQRIDGPRVPPAARHPAKADAPAAEAPAPAVAAKPASAAAPERTDAGPILLLLMGLAGLSMIAGGLRLLTRAQPPVGVTR